MSVFSSLSEGHALMLNLVARLDRADDAKEVRNLLLVLLRALEAHEGLEQLVFDPGPGDAGPERAALALVERQHIVLGELRTQAAVLLADLDRENDASIQTLARSLALLLRRHFEYEERTLWPHFNASAGRSRLQRLDRLARAQVQAMKKELDGYWAAFDD